LKLNKAELINIVADKTNTSKIAAGRSVDAVIEAISASVANGVPVSIIGFGHFERRERTARIGKNPANGVEMHYPAISVPAFRPGKAFKQLVKLKGSKNNV
jgi:DNA-binding protein HU-beta